ncbi:uncharacterized protein V6R79_012511 [Siganus canaliculatus]
MGSQILFSVLVLGLLRAVTSQGPPPGHFYPIDGQSSSITDDGSSPLITLEQPLMFFGTSYNQIYVNNNGLLSFVTAVPNFLPETFPLFEDDDIIAPLWSDFNVIDGGQITYNQYIDGSVLLQATQDINAYFPELSFNAESVFVASWYKVPYFGNNVTETTFQGVLISGGGYSFVLLNYGSIAETDNSVEAGYDTIMSIHSESITSSVSGSVTGPNSGLSLGSNVGVAGRWVFRIDNGTRTLTPQEPLVPIEGETNPEILDGSSPAISLLSPFYCYGRAYEQLYVNNNGHITFDAPWSSYTPEMFPLFGIRDIIAVCWGDFDIRQSGQVYYEQYTSGSLLQELTQDINNYFPGLDFNAEWALVASWYKVPTFQNPGTQSTFQAILVTGGEYSFAILNYEAIALTNQNLQAGFDTVNSTFYYNVPGSFSDSSMGNASTFLLDSNVGVPGRWVFRTDEGTRGSNFNVFSGNLYPVFGEPSARSLDGSSSATSLPTPFVFFGASYDELYANNNGHITFLMPFSAFIPQMFPVEGNKDIIAPFWRDFDTRETGHVFSMLYTDGIVLEQATSDINQYFPGLDFSADWVYVATWYEVAYFEDERSQSTFQGVLIRGDHYSFLMLNYGNIATATGNAQAGFDTINSITYYSIPGSFDGGVGNDRPYVTDSNVGVPGRWVLRVDHGTRDCL